jgi:DNA-binding transcriptional ArsR family regulator
MNVHEASALNAFGRLDPLVHEPARLMILASLFLADSREAPVLQRITGLSWGNLSAHLSKLETAGLVNINKYFKGKRPGSTILLTESGRRAFMGWRRNLAQGLRHLDAVRPDLALRDHDCRIHILPVPETPWQQRSALRERSLTVPGGRWLFPLHGVALPDSVTQSV